MRREKTHIQCTNKCRGLFVAAIAAMSMTGMSPVLAVENPIPAFPKPDRVEEIHQKKHVTGNVQDANGMPLIGASVIIKGTNNGVITDVDGNFSLEAASNQIVVISYIGMQPIEMRIPNNGQIRVVMNEDAQLIDEVVVTGYGDFKKATYTGSASVLNTEKLESLPVTTVAQMMEANIPGLSMVASSSQPGSKSTVRVRGIASMNASTEPLYVLDGVPVASRDMSGMSSEQIGVGGMGIIESLNPADIESITVLKDAASASLYGAKGSNGVILITTKKGKEGKMRVNMQATYGITDLAYNFRPTMGGEERRNLIYEGFVNYRLNNGDSEAEARSYADGQIDNYAARPANGYADWEKALMQKGHQQDYSLSVGGGTEKTNFIGSLGYTNQTGVSINSGMERFTGRLDASSKWNKFDFGMNATFTWMRNKYTPEGQYYASALYSSKRELHPSIPIYNEDGSYHTGFQNNGGINPLYENSVDSNYGRMARTMASAKAGYTILDGLKLSTIFTIDYALNKDFYFYSPDGKDGEATQGSGQLMFIERMTYTSQTNLAYNKTFGKHNVNAVIAYEVMKYDFEDMYGEKQVYGQSINTSLDNGAKPADLTNTRQEDAMVSYVGNFNYGYNDRYYAGFSFRRDGSSRLAPDKRWGNFWAVSGSWRLSQENFMKPLESVISDMKLRASYGVNGNLPNKYYDYHGIYTTGAFYNGKPAPWEDAIANPDLTWEKNYALNIGLDLSLFRRVNLTFDWYTRTTKDLLMSKQLNSISGFENILTNVGEMKNKGLEMEIRSSNIQTKDFSWTTSLNLSHNKNKIVKLADLPEFISGNYIRKEGYSYATLYLREYAGVDPDDGRPMYYDNKLDENGNRTKNKVYDPNEAERVIQKDIYPKLTGGLMNTFNYKFIDLSFNLSFHLGGYSYDGAMYSLQDDGYSAQYNKSTELRRRWQKPGDITDIPRYVYGQEYGGWWNSSRGIHSTNHLRLKSVIVGVSAPKEWLRNVGISSARLYFSGTNLLTWAAYDQYDPELNGIVSFFTPPLKTYAFGLELKF